MRRELADQLLKALQKIDRPGTFCVSGSAAAVLPGLEVKGLGPVGLPLTARQAEELRTLCHQAPYGKGEKTLVDTSVRNVWELEPDRFALTNPEWQKFLKQTVHTVQQELGLEKQKLESHLYDLLLYEPGSFFLPHRDGEKLDRMVATLVVVLPSPHEGGELVVRHEGQERTIDFGSAANNSFQIHFVAFYADCEHEVRPLRKGYRLCLVYNLTLAKSKKAVRAPRTSEHVEKITSLLREWTADESARKLVITLDHQYTQDGLSWDTLKGADRAKADILAAAAQQAGCKSYLALLTFHESGSAEGEAAYAHGYDRRRRWYDDDEEEEEAGNYEMGEVVDSSLTADHWQDRDGRGLPLNALPVDEDELLDPEALTAVDPEEEFEGYTGNAGMTLDRWYRHAAMILWPQRRHFEILCDAGSERVVPLLEEMVKQWRQAGGADAAVLKEQCTELAAGILTRWPANQYGYPYSSSTERADLLKTLAALEEPELIRRYLGDVVLKDASLDPSKSLVSTCEKFGWATFQRELQAIVQGSTATTLLRNVRLLEKICLAKPRKKEGWSELCVALAPALVTVLETIDREKPQYEWQAPRLERAELLAGLAQALIATEQWELLGRLVAHTRAMPTKYPLTEAHLQALTRMQSWLEEHVKKPSPPLAEWLAWCREQLEELTTQAPQKPADFQREALVSCNCADCAELKKFLRDPREPVHHFRVRQDRRNHLENNIRQHKCDLDCKTEQRGTPYTLVCTKNTASYQAKLNKYYQDLEYLKMVRALQGKPRK